MCSAIQCPLGSWLSCAGKVRCDNCTAGRYCPRVDATFLCPAKFYCPPASSQPTPCPAGSYCPLGSAFPSACPAGYFCPSGSAVKLPCLSGSYCPAAASAPVACISGCLCPAGSASPVCQKSCPAGYYRNGLSCSACSTSQCPAGSYRSACTATADGQCASCTNLNFTSLSSSNSKSGNTYDIDGVYAVDTAQVNGMPIYINAAKSRFLAYSVSRWSSSWAIAATQSLSALKASGGSFNNILSNGGGGSPLVGWSGYAVTFPLDAPSTCASAWACPSGYFLSGPACQQCSSPACPVGQYSTLCAATADAACQACTNLAPNSVFTTAGSPGSPASCGTACAAGYYLSGAACTKCQVTFATKPNRNGECSGTYVSDPARTFNGRPVYVNSAKSRYLVYSVDKRGGYWVVTGTQPASGSASGGAVSGYHSNDSPDVTEDWDDYDVQKPGQC